MTSKRPLDWHKKLKQEVLADPEAKLEYEAYALQLKLAEQLKNARKRANLTQQDVAEKMDTQKSVIARLEAGGGKGKSSPSLKTLIKYAQAIGKTIEIKLGKEY
jgi:DNA-binding XRE family transcriptional regulator